MNSTTLEEVWQSVVALRDDWKDEAHRGLSQELGHIADNLQDLRDIHERGVSYEWACRFYDLITVYNRMFQHETGDGPADILRNMLAPLLGAGSKLSLSAPSEMRTLHTSAALGKVIVRGALIEKPFLSGLAEGQRVLAELTDGDGKVSLRVVKWKRWNTISRDEAYYGVVVLDGIERSVAAHRIWDYNAEMNAVTKRMLQAKVAAFGLSELFYGTKKDYPWGPGDNDNYLNVCVSCDVQYRGHKHSSVCAECQAIHKEWWQALTPDEQAAYDRATLAELHKALEARKKDTNVHHT